MANVLVLRLFMLTSLYYLLCGMVDGFVYESVEYDDAPSFRDATTRKYGNENIETQPYLAESNIKVKKFALAVFFKTNWFRASQYCRYRGMQLASVETAKEEKELEFQIESVGFELGPTWTSGTDLSEEGVYFWASTGTPVTFTKWAADQPNGERDENCLHLDNDPREGFSWHDDSCASEYYFACEYFSSNLNSTKQIPLYV